MDSISLIDEIQDGEIPSGSEDGKLLHFTDDLLYGRLEKRGNILYLHFIASIYPREGNVTRWIRFLLKETPFDVRVSRPCEIMKHILKKFGFIEAYEHLEYYNGILTECWKRDTL